MIGCEVMAVEIGSCKAAVGRSGWILIFWQWFSSVWVVFFSKRILAWVCECFYGFGFGDVITMV